MSSSVGLRAAGTLDIFVDDVEKRNLETFACKEKGRKRWSCPRLG